MNKPVDTPGQLPIRPEWIALGYESAVEPDLPIIDPHHHLWDPAGARYLFDEFRADLESGHDIRATVFVECQSMHRATGPAELRPVGETEFIAGIAAQSDSGRYGNTRACAAIVGHVDLRLGAHFAPVLEAHAAAAGGRLRGFRGRVSSHPDASINKWATPPGVLRTIAAREAAEIIAARGLVLDIWAYQTQHDDIIDLCRNLPNLMVVLDHSAGPLVCGPVQGRRDEQFVTWREGVRALAALPNCTIKFGGLGMRFAGFDYDRRERPPSSDDLAADWKPYFETCLEAFGPDRLMFESNFPADKGSYGYGTLWNAFKKLSAGMSEAERAQMFFGTAQHTYKML